ncbi:MAG: NifB/NifX family molybdenum-iron cluster-binding protein [Acidobacteriota bacterium]
MDILKIAVPSNDGVTIFKGMLGRAEKFLIFEMRKGIGVNLLEIRDNPYAETLQHLKTLDVYSLIDDCKIILSASIGKKGIERLEKREVKLVFGKGNISDHINKISI